MKKAKNVVLIVVTCVAVTGAVALTVFAVLRQPSASPLRVCPVEGRPSPISDECPELVRKSTAFPLSVRANVPPDSSEFKTLRSACATVNRVKAVLTLFDTEVESPDVDVLFREPHDPDAFSATETTSFMRRGERWLVTIRVGNTPDDTVLYVVLVHALGHALSLRHSTDQSSFMYPTVDPELEPPFLPRFTDPETALLQSL
jgi:hypothetical protein